ncbi:MAG: hypothetical protein ACJ786_21790 [Catenulispora sp.]
MTVTEYATGDVYRVLGKISEDVRLSRPEFGELPLTHITHRKKAVMTIVPAWLGEWIEANAAEVLQRHEEDQRRIARESAES